MKHNLPVNVDILRQCREQMNLSIEDVKKKVNVKTIEKIEDGERRPTIKQLDDLAKLYGVPSWVFISDSLPEQYAYIQKASFRQFKDSEAYEDSNVRRLVVKIERYRDLFIEMQCDIDELVAFRAPKVNRRDPILKTAKVVREWLDMDTPLDHLQIREKLERKGIFVFLTSKYRGWSHIEKDGFRGLCLQHTTTPIIIVNDSDSKKAQSFTLIHELGHLLLSSDSIDSWQKDDSDGEEQWRDKLAGYVLMPDSGADS